MPHGRYMRGTRLDYVLAVGLTGLILFVITLSVNPVRSFAYARDEARMDGVREIMTAIMQMPVDNRAKYEALLDRAEGREGQRFMLGNGASCAGSWGKYCEDGRVPDDCLPVEEIFASEDFVPVDPKTSTFGTFATGYYVSFDKDEIEVGACSSDMGAVRMRTLVR